MSDKAIPLSYLSKLKEQCDELYQAKGSGGGTIEYMTDEEVDALFVEDELIGMWIFKDNPTVSEDLIANISFISNGNSYSKFELRHAFGPNFEMLYDETFVCDQTGFNFQEDKTIQITNTSALTNREEFTTWLKANATKQ